MRLRQWFCLRWRVLPETKLKLIDEVAAVILSNTRRVLAKMKLGL